ncbi:MAG: hypothetical protein LBV23_03890 [Deltaproteobacteria bacterium]|jgi:hypothetical protein|nr:hypothetical protein [Deltaproteobacteria bacterium]
MAFLRETGILITARIRPCANDCQFCLLYDRTTDIVPVDRCVSIVEKFLDYGERCSLIVKQWFGNAYDYNLEDFRKLFGLFVRNGLGDDGAQDFRYLMVGGLPFMGEESARRWIRERIEVGCGYAAGTYAGPPEVHDELFSKKGHFAFQRGFQKIASEEGLKLMEKVIMLVPYLGHLEEILAHLDIAGPCEDRRLILMSYSGRGRAFEAFRPTRDDLLVLPAGILKLFQQELDEWKTESQWAEEIGRSGEEGYEDWLPLRLTERNLESIENQSCTEILDRLRAKTKARYAPLPGALELAKKYCDSKSLRLYKSRSEVECLWLDRFGAKNPEVGFDGSLPRFNW